MGTPSFVKFSKIGKMEDILMRLQKEVFSPWNVRLESVGQLRESHNNLDGGLELVDDKLYPCSIEEELILLAKNWTAVGLIYKLPIVPCNIFLYFFDKRPDGCACTLSFDSSLVYFQSEAFSKGQWLTGFLAGLVSGLQATVCGYGPDDAYEIKHESLESEQLIFRLREGDLLTIDHPVMHAFSTDVISQLEMESLLRSRPKTSKLKYSLTLKGYHLLTAIP